VAFLAIPEFVWEAFLGFYCAIWGFKRDSPILFPRTLILEPEPRPRSAHGRRSTLIARR
jgi:hypothetical protein